MTVSYWLDRPYPPGPPLEGNHTADALVIGAGITGSLLACHLGDRRLKVTVLELDTVASGASGRNLGFLVSGLGEHYARSVEFWGRESAAAISRFHLQNHDLLADFVVRNQIRCDYARDGSFVLAIDAEEEDLLRRSYPLLLEDGFACEYKESSEISKILGTAGFFGGLFNPLDGCVDPVGLTRGAAAVVRAGGGRIFERSGVRRIREGAGHWTLETEKGTATAPLLFLAVNAWTPILLPQLRLQPVRGQCLAIGPLRSPPIPTPCYTNYGSEYWRGSGRHTLMGGMRRAGKSSETGLDDGVTHSVQQALEGFRSAHFPGLEREPIAYRWSGIMSYSGDGLPLIGAVRDREGLFLAGGYTGHGLGWAFLAARWLSRLAVEGVDEIPGICRLDRKIRPSPALEEI